MDQAPYPVVLVKLEDGKHVTCQLVDYDPAHVSFGQKVITVIRRVTHPDPDGGSIPGEQDRVRFHARHSGPGERTRTRRGQDALQAIIAASSTP